MVNNSPSQSVVHDAIRPPYRISIPVGALILRLLVGVTTASVAALAVVQILTQGPPNDGFAAWCNWFLIGAGGIFGIPSLVVAGGLAFKKKWALWTAVIYDSLVLILVLGYMTSAFVVQANALTWLLMVPALVFLVEGFLLARLVWDRDRYCLAVALSLCLGMSIPAISRHAYISRYEPLLAYIRSNWVDLSSDYQIYTGGPRELESIRLRNNSARSEVFIYFKPVGKGRWQFAGSSGLGKHGPALELHNYNRTGSSSSARDALGRLRAQGVRVADLKHVGTMGADPNKCYVFESTKAGGTYTVSGLASEVQFYPLKTVVVP